MAKGEHAPRLPLVHEHRTPLQMHDGTLITVDREELVAALVDEQGAAKAVQARAATLELKKLSQNR